MSSPAHLRVAITGGTSGLGLALVEALSARGDRVAFVARGAARVAAVARAHPGTHGIVGDVADKTRIHAMALEIAGALGGVDVLVHNASSLGPVPLVPLADTDCEAVETALATNVLGPFRLTKALLGALAKTARERTPEAKATPERTPEAHAARGGATAERAAPPPGALVVHVSSDAAVTPYAGWGAYAASKAALLQLGRVWNEELAPLGIAVVDVDPGDMDTPLHALAAPDADPATLKRPRDAAAELIARIDAALGRSAAAARVAA